MKLFAKQKILSKVSPKASRPAEQVDLTEAHEAMQADSWNLSAESNMKTSITDKQG